MNVETFDREYRERLERLSTTNLSDALDKVGIRGAVIGILPLFGKPRVAGRAVTIKITASGLERSKHHLGVEAIATAHKGDIIAIDNRGDTYNNCWGEILACASKMKGVSAVVIDGATRDVDACEEMGFPVFAKAVVPLTARGRIVQESFNCPIRLGNVLVRPGDIIVADASGVVVLPPERVDEVLSEAEKIMEKEEAMKRDLLAGMDVLDMDQKYDYERMLRR